MPSRLSPSGLAVMYAHTILTKHAAAKPGEQIMIMADTESDADMVNGFMAAGNILGVDTTLVVIPPSFDVTERWPTKVAEKALEACDLYLAMTKTTGHSVHLKSVAERMHAKKLRFVVTGGWHGAGLDRAVALLREHDYEVVYDWALKLAAAINGHENVHLTSKEGTDLRFSIKGISYGAVGGFAREPGTVCAFPDGEAWGGPVEGTANGVVVVNGGLAQVCTKPHPSEPVVLTLRDGRVVDCKGGAEAEELKKVMETDENANNLAEFSLGTNPYTIPCGDVNGCDKKLLGTCHIAVGDNEFQIYPHGTCHSRVHCDMVLYNHTVEVDGRFILRDGKVMI